MTSPKTDRITLYSLAQPVAEAPALEELRDWTCNFLMRDHPDLGRAGNVCPFTAFGARIDTLRFGVSDARPSEAARIRRELLGAFTQFDEMPHPEKMGVYRAILIAFPNCLSEDGVAALSRTQKSLRLTSFLRRRMIGVFYPDAPEPGLWNSAFRPLRAPLPIIAIRSLVAADAAFVMRHPLLAPTYLCNFPLTGPKELAALRLRKA